MSPGDKIEDRTKGQTGEHVPLEISDVEQNSETYSANLEWIDPPIVPQGDSSSQTVLRGEPSQQPEQPVISDQQSEEPKGSDSQQKSKSSGNRAQKIKKARTA